MTISCPSAGAFNETTHRLINFRANDVALIDGDLSLDAFLKGSVGLVSGILTQFSDLAPRQSDIILTNNAFEWLLVGATQEDEPFCRSARHFHDPLRAWSDAGLNSSDPVSAALIAAVCGAFSFPSSAIWSQRANQDDGVGGPHSWLDARTSFATALTSVAQADRDRAWANTFRSIGQVMHLVADASVPEHVRNDPHILESVFQKAGLSGYGNYDFWVEQHPELPFSGAPPFDRSILRQPTNVPEAPVPIARLIDTDTYTGAASGPSVTLNPAIGIAEFANANFFSEDTGNRNLLGRNYPYPAIDLLVPSLHPAPSGPNLRRYYKKGADGGLLVDPVLAECVLDEAARAAGLPAPGTYNCVDENVWRATANEMVPRAVDYAAGVLEYFFRGRLEIAAPDRFAYGLSTYQPGNTGGFNTLRFKVRNATPDEDPGAAGRMRAIVQYRKPAAGVDLIQNPFASLSAELYFAVSEIVPDVVLTADFREFAFTFRPPFPANSADVFLMVVYEGPLGFEHDAVMVGGKDLLEPDPLDVGNATDWECVDGVAYQVSDFVQYPPFHPPGQTQRDVTGDGNPDLSGPAVSHNTFTKTFDLSQSTPMPSEANFDQYLPLTSFAQYGRVMLLQDQPTYGAAVLSRDVVQTPSGAVIPNDFRVAALQGVYNDSILNPRGQIQRRITASIPYRGLALHHAILLVSDSTLPCVGALNLKEPDLTRIPSVVAAP